MLAKIHIISFNASLNKQVFTDQPKCWQVEALCKGRSFHFTTFNCGAFLKYRVDQNRFLFV